MGCCLVGEVGCCLVGEVGCCLVGEVGCCLGEEEVGLGGLKRASSEFQSLFPWSLILATCCEAS